MQVPANTNKSAVQKQSSAAVPRPDPTFLMMAAAQMHSEGRLFKPGSTDPTMVTPPQ